MAVSGNSLGSGSFGSSAPTGGGIGNLGGWLGLASGVVGLVSGLFRGRQARRMERQNPYPTATVDPLIAENQARAQQMAQVGLPQAQYNLALQNIQRNQAGALRAAQQSSRGPVNVASIVDRTNQATLQLDAADAAARMQNQRLAMQQNSALAAENQRAWNWNEAQRYQELAGRIAQLRTAGQQDLWGGIGMLGQLAASGTFNNLLGGGGNNSGGNSGGGWLSGLFGGGNNQAATQQPGTPGFGGYNTLGNQPTGMAPYYGPAA